MAELRREAAELGAVLADAATVNSVVRRSAPGWTRSKW
jgi:hypothetical protein